MSFHRGIEKTAALGMTPWRKKVILANKIKGHLGLLRGVALKTLHPLGIDPSGITSVLGDNMEDLGIRRSWRATLAERILNGEYTRLPKKSTK
jgi:hypothetical protein